MKAKGSVLESKKYRAPLGSVAPALSLPDVSRWGNDGVFTDVTWVQLPSGLWVMSFNGTSSYVDCGADESLNVGIRDFTLEAWVNVQSAIPYQCVMTKDYNNLHYYMLEVYTGRAYIYLAQQYPVNVAYAISTTYIDDGGWHHIIGLRRSGTIHVHVDGGASEDSDAANFNIDNTGILRVGSRIAATYFTGYIYPRVYCYALSQDEISKHFEAERRFFGV